MEEQNTENLIYCTFKGKLKNLDLGSLYVNVVTIIDDVLGDIGLIDIRCSSGEVDSIKYKLGIEMTDVQKAELEILFKRAMMKIVDIDINTTQTILQNQCAGNYYYVEYSTFFYVTEQEERAINKYVWDLFSKLLGKDIEGDVVIYDSKEEFTIEVDFAVDHDLPQEQFMAVNSLLFMILDWVFEVVDPEGEDNYDYAVT